MEKRLLFWATIALHTVLYANESPMLFVKNEGQWDARIQYIADLNMGKLLLEKNQLTFYVHDLNRHKHHHNSTQTSTLKQHIFRIKFEGANTEQLIPEEKESAYRNYYIGKNSAYWRSNVPVYRKNTFKNLYAGIDLVVSGNENGFIYEYIVSAGTNPSVICQQYEGVGDVKIKNGEINYRTSFGKVTEKNIVAYQIINGKKQIVKCVLKKRSANSVSYEFPDGYDLSQTLIIDPTVVFGTYTGATADNWGYTATYDQNGNMYVGGYVNAAFSGTTYPTTTGAFQTVFGGGSGNPDFGGGNGIGFPYDMGITKFSTDGSTLMYSTYLGGSDNETPHSLVVDAQDNLIIYGVSYSANYPVSANAYDNSYNGNADIVVTKFNSSGTALLGSTYIGGTSLDGINFNPDAVTYGNLKFNYGDQNRGEVNVDAANNIYVASCTRSMNFPVSGNAYQSNNRGGQDGCAFKLNNNCSQLLWSTYIGGANDDACYALDVKSNGELYVCGGTMSNNFPATSDAWNPSYRGGLYDGFVALISNNGSQLLHSSFIGTSGNDQVFFVKIGDGENVYFVGQTTGIYPIINATYSNPNSGQFITKLNSTLSTVAYSTVFGNGNRQPNISPTAFLVDTCENVYVAGWGSASPQFGSFLTNMYNLPLTPDAHQSTTDGTDFYNFVLAKNAAGILYGSYFGGNGTIEHVDGGTNRFDSRGIIYEAICAGCGGNSLTPSTPGVWSPTNQSFNCNLFGLKMEFNLGKTEVRMNAHPRAIGCVPLTVQFTSLLYNTSSILWDFQDGTISTEPNPVHTFTNTGTYRVQLIGTGQSSCNLSDTAYIDVWVRDDSLMTNFSENVTIDCENQTVYMSASNSSTTSYLWQLGDGTTATSSSVSHQYPQSGNYTVKLILTDSTRCNLQDSFATSIFIPPVVDVQIAASDTHGCVPLNVTFFNTTNYAEGAYRWYFGDGDSSNARAPSHVYQNAGIYHGVVYWEDSFSCNKQDTVFFTITVVDSSADASFEIDRQFFGCDSVQITVQSNYVGADSARWIWGDGNFSTDNPTSHTYISPFFDTLTHILYDAKQVCRPIDTHKIIISLEPLNTAIYVPDTIGCIPFTASFYGTSQLLTTEYFWFFPNGDSASGGNAQHTFSSVGSHTVLMVSQDLNACVGLDSNYTTIEVIDDFVDAQLSITILNDCDSNLHIQFHDESINAVDYFWQFGDGLSSTLTNPEHHYTQPGTYAVTLIVTDSSRCHPIDSIIHYVRLKPNTVALFDAMNVCAENEVQFTNFSIHNNAVFMWFFGDGGISIQQNPVYTYSTSGTYNVSLVVNDTSSCNILDTLHREIVIYPKPHANFYLERDTYKFQTPVVFQNQSGNSDSYVWNFGDGMTSTDISPTYEYTRSVGWHRVCLEAYLSDAPCEDTICDSIFVDFKPLVGVPNAFSPNGDGINDVVRVEGKGIVELDFRIFNRWGQLIYHGTDQREGWNGFFKNEKQEMEVYTYLVVAKMVDGQTIELKGNITLLQ